MDKTNFIKVKEDFTCTNCSEEVAGDGYTNHCSKCLYSVHVDEEFPGDRKSGCKGLMKPVEVDKKGDKFIIIHECVKCGKRMKNKVSEDDDFEAVLNLLRG